MEKIIITFDVEKKTVNKVEGTDEISPIDISKVLMSVAMQALNKVQIEPKSKIEIVKPKIIGGSNNGGK